ncbi:MAG: hypothetical protein PHH98_00445 [Candidatus Gracilibacteria bacterium]|nr:hypothetical protein [Candidatus Gracilibacteria bacterium]
MFYIISIRFGSMLGYELVHYILLPLAFIMLNYSFIKLILYYIGYYNNLLIFHEDKIIVIKSTLLDTDNVEIIDLHKITKIDAFANGIFANIFGYGTLVIEQQRDKVREFWYVPKPYKAISMLNEVKEKNLEKNK